MFEFNDLLVTFQLFSAGDLFSTVAPSHMDFPPCGTKTTCGTPNTAGSVTQIKYGP